jgi:hypothetical protein
MLILILIPMPIPIPISTPTLTLTLTVTDSDTNAAADDDNDDNNGHDIEESSVRDDDLSFQDWIIKNCPLGAGDCKCVVIAATNPGFPCGSGLFIVANPTSNSANYDWYRP